MRRCVRFLGLCCRRLPRLLKEAGVTDISIGHEIMMFHWEFVQLLMGGHVAKAVESGVLSAEKSGLWWTQLAHAKREGNFVFGFTGWVVAGTKA